MTSQAAALMTDEALRKFARWGADLSTLTYNQRLDAGCARFELRERDRKVALA